MTAGRGGSSWAVQPYLCLLPTLPVPKQNSRRCGNTAPGGVCIPCSGVKVAPGVCLQSCSNCMRLQITISPPHRCTQAEHCWGRREGRVLCTTATRPAALQACSSLNPRHAGRQQVAELDGESAWAAGRAWRSRSSSAAKCVCCSCKEGCTGVQSAAHKQHDKSCHRFR